MNSMMKQQRGMALIISLIILLLMTIIGLAAMRTSLMEEKMAANSRDQALAFQASEIGLRDQERWLMSQTLEPLPTDDGSNGIWNPDSVDPVLNNAISWWQEPNRNITWWNANGRAYGQNITNVKSPPQSIIEFHQYISDDLVMGDGNTDAGRVFYRITTRGTGGSDQARILLQSTVAKRY